MMKNLCLLLGSLLLVAVSPPAWAQSGSTGASSTAGGRFLDNFRRQGSSQELRRATVDRDTRVGGGGGWGASAVRAPTSLGRSPAASRPSRSRAATFGTGISRPGAKPFSNVTPTPTVSPYLNLFREGFGDNNDLNYQTLVQPQLRQQRVNRQVNVQSQQLNRKLISLTARNAYNVQGSTTLAPTGHAASFQNYSRFYPGKSRARR